MYHILIGGLVYGEIGTYAGLSLLSTAIMAIATAIYATYVLNTAIFKHGDTMPSTGSKSAWPFEFSQGMIVALVAINAVVALLAFRSLRRNRLIDGRTCERFKFVYAGVMCALFIAAAHWRSGLLADESDRIAADSSYKSPAAFNRRDDPFVSCWLPDDARPVTMTRRTCAHMGSNSW